MAMRASDYKKRLKNMGYYKLPSSTKRLKAMYEQLKYLEEKKAKRPAPKKATWKVVGDYYSSLREREKMEADRTKTQLHMDVDYVTKYLAKKDPETKKKYVYLVDRSGGRWYLKKVSPDKYARLYKDRDYDEYRVVSPKDYEVYKAKREKEDRQESEKAREARAREKELDRIQTQLKASGLDSSREAAKKVVIVPAGTVRKLKEAQAVKEGKEETLKRDPSKEIKNWEELTPAVQKSVKAAYEKADEAKIEDIKKEIELKKQETRLKTTLSVLTGLEESKERIAVKKAQEEFKAQLKPEAQKTYEKFLTGEMKVGEDVGLYAVGGELIVAKDQKAAESLAAYQEEKIQAAAKKAAEELLLKEKIEGTKVKAIEEVMPVFGVKPGLPAVVTTPTVTEKIYGKEITEKVSVAPMGAITGEFFGAPKKDVRYTALTFDGLEAADPIPQKVSTTGRHYMEQKMCDKSGRCATYMVEYDKGKITRKRKIEGTDTYESDWEKKRTTKLQQTSKDVLKELEKTHEEEGVEYKYREIDGKLQRVEEIPVEGIWGKLPRWLVPPWIDTKIKPTPVGITDVTGKVVAGLGAVPAVTAKMPTGVGMAAITSMAAVEPTVSYLGEETLAKLKAPPVYTPTPKVDFYDVAKPVVTPKEVPLTVEKMREQLAGVPGMMFVDPTQLIQPDVTKKETYDVLSQQLDVQTPPGSKWFFDEVETRREIDRLEKIRDTGMSGFGAQYAKIEEDTKKYQGDITAWNQEAPRLDEADVDYEKSRLKAQEVKTRYDAELEKYEADEDKTFEKWDKINNLYQQHLITQNVAVAKADTYDLLAERLEPTYLRAATASEELGNLQTDVDTLNERQEDFINKYNRSIEQVRESDILYKKKKEHKAEVESKKTPWLATSAMIPFTDVEVPAIWSPKVTGIVGGWGLGGLEILGRNIPSFLAVEPARVVKRDVEEVGLSGALRRQIGLEWAPTKIPGTDITVKTPVAIPGVPGATTFVRGVYDPYQPLKPGEEEWDVMRWKTAEGALDVALIGAGAAAGTGVAAAKPLLGKTGQVLGKVVKYGIPAIIAGPEIYQVAKGTETPVGALYDIAYTTGKLTAVAAGAATAARPPIRWETWRGPGTPTATVKGTTYKMNPETGTFKIAGKVYKPTPKMTLKVGGETVPIKPGETVITRGVTTHVGKRGVPLITQADGKWQLGFHPSVNLKTVRRGLINSVTIPVGRAKGVYPIGQGQTSVKIAGRAYKIQPDMSIMYGGKKIYLNSPAFIAETPAQMKIAKESLPQIMKKTEYLKRFGPGGAQTTESLLYRVQGRPQMSNIIQGTRTLNKRGVEEVLLFTTNKKGTIYGSFVQHKLTDPYIWQQARGYGISAKPGDIDVKLFLSEKDTAKAASELAHKLRLAGNNVRVSPTNPTLIVDKAGRHVVDIHSLEIPADELASYSVTQTGSYGIPYTGAEIKLKYPGGEVSGMTLGEQYVRKGASIYSIRTGPTGQVQFLPEPYRAKDVADYFAAAQQAAITKGDAGALNLIQKQQMQYMGEMPFAFPKGSLPVTTTWTPSSVSPSLVPVVSSVTAVSGFPQQVWSMQDYYRARGMRVPTSISASLKKQLGAISPAPTTISVSPYGVGKPSISPAIPYEAPSTWMFRAEEGVTPSTVPASLMARPYRSLGIGSPAPSVSPYIESPSVSASLLSKYIPSTSPYPSTSVSPSPYEPPSPPPPSNGSRRSVSRTSGPPGSPRPSPSPYPSPYTYPSPGVTGVKFPTLGGFGGWMPEGGYLGYDVPEGTREWTVVNLLRDLPGEWLARQRIREEEMFGVSGSMGGAVAGVTGVGALQKYGQPLVTATGKGALQATPLGQQRLGMGAIAPAATMPVMQMQPMSLQKPLQPTRKKVEPRRAKAEKAITKMIGQGKGVSQGSLRALLRGRTK